MRLGDKALFKDQKKLTKMLNLRLNGYSIRSLAVIYGCDRTSIKAQCQKYDIAPVYDTYSIVRILAPLLPKVDYVDRRVDLKVR